MARLCSMPGCLAAHSARGVCKDHYNDWYNGKIELPDYGDLRAAHSDPEESFAARTERVGDHLVWTGAPFVGGAGRISVGGKQVTARRYAWEREHGPVPHGRVVRGTCGRSDCVEPTHATVPRWGTSPNPAAGLEETTGEIRESLPISVNPLGDGYVAEVGDIYREVFPTFVLAAAGALEASARHSDD